MSSLVDIWYCAVWLILYVESKLQFGIFWSTLECMSSKLQQCFFDLEQLPLFWVLLNQLMHLLIQKWFHFIAGTGLLSFPGHNASRCEASQYYDWSRVAETSPDWLGSCWILPSWQRVQCPSSFKVEFNQIHEISFSLYFWKTLWLFYRGWIWVLSTQSTFGNSARMFVMFCKRGRTFLNLIRVVGTVYIDMCNFI